MGQTGTQRKEILEKNCIPGKIPVFTMQGNFNVEKLQCRISRMSRKSRIILWSPAFCKLLKNIKSVSIRQ